MKKENGPKHFNPDVLLSLAQLYQREPASLVELFTKESSKLLDKLRNHLEQFDLKHILCVLRDLRYNSVEIGAAKFSFLLLSLEIAATEYRLDNWPDAMKVIERHHRHLIEELSTMRFSQPECEAVA